MLLRMRTSLMLGILVGLLGHSVQTAASGSAEDQAAAPVAAERIKELIEQLGADDFATRQRADMELEKLGGAALPALRGVLAGKPNLEMNQRVERLINRIDVKLWRCPSGYAIKKRLERVIQLNAQLGDEQAVNAAYLLTVARSPTERETARAMEQLKQTKDRRWAVLDLARSLVHSREFSEEVAVASARLLDVQADLQAADQPQLVLLANTQKISEQLTGMCGKLVKATDALTQRQTYEVFFLATLSRFPTDKEIGTLEQRLPLRKERERQLTDLLWAILNCNEFVRKR